METENLLNYCRHFSNWSSDWPSLPLKNSEQVEWWEKWLDLIPKNSSWQELRKNLPQLFITPEEGARLGSQYKQLVLQGKNPSPKDISGGLKEPKGFEVFLKKHWSGSIPVIRVNQHFEFTNILQCLVHRCEPVQIQESVHSQAVSGLIHWGLINTFGKSHRCNILVLHDSPYSSISFQSIPGMKTEDDWISCSHLWRLEHELTHIACKLLVGEMRLNVYDELLADAMGMRASLGYFDAKLFALTLGIDSDGTANNRGRVFTYTKELNDNEQKMVQKLVLERAHELEDMLNHEISGIDDISLLRILTRNKLDKKLTI